eukprot:TRINITY_DN25123_c0_g1_i1.p1 TRINITY_DN25123_c0_g1~~TRINITY_DN25123_c0_g1_i1.p1  ORF type:complete len:192 (+),score=28.62 TRINITY_DN25123_c0_g1_i1:113-688(+)
MTNLRFLDLSINHITQIQNLPPNLEKLNLSNNRINRIENLGQCPRLQSIDLSMNYLDRIDNLDSLSSLKELNLTGNKLKVVEGLDNLGTLEKLVLARNEIGTLNGLMLIKRCAIKHLDVSYNLIRLEALNELEYTLKAMDRLEFLDLTGNEITLAKTYHYTILQANSKIKKLDGLAITSYQMQNIEVILRF